MKSFFYTLFLGWLSLGIHAQTTLNLSLEHDGISRDYAVYIPDSYTGDDAVPLLFNFHGFGSNGFEQTFYGDFRSIADTAGFILIHPEGTLISGSAHWNVGGFTAGSTTDDVGFTNAMIDTISANYNINAERIYSTGMSNGGFFSFRLACELSNRIAAIASVTGSMTPETLFACNPQHAMPMMQIHGTTDAVVPYDGGVLWSKSIEDVMTYWINFNNCDATPQVNEVPDMSPNDNCTADHFIYTNPDTEITTEHFKIYDGGHTWPGAPFNFAGTNQDFNASDEIWKFFSRYDINGFNPIITTSTKELEINKLSVFPNPASSTIQVRGFAEKTMPYRILNSNGQELKSGVLSGQDQIIDLSELPADLYLLNTGFQSIKIMKIN